MSDDTKREIDESLSIDVKSLGDTDTFNEAGSGGPIVLREYDVLFGRGGHANTYIGNLHFRSIVDEFKPLYEQAARGEKGNVAQIVIDAVRHQEPPGRFLERTLDNNFALVPESRVHQKVSQRLREKDTSSQKASLRSTAAKCVPKHILEDQKLPLTAKTATRFPSMVVVEAGKAVVSKSAQKSKKVSSSSTTTRRKGPSSKKLKESQRLNLDSLIQRTLAEKLLDEKHAEVLYLPGTQALPRLCGAFGRGFWSPRPLTLEQPDHFLTTSYPRLPDFSSHSSADSLAGDLDWFDVDLALSDDCASRGRSEQSSPLTVFEGPWTATNDAFDPSYPWEGELFY